MRERLDKTDDVFEIDVLERIIDEYDDSHKNNLKAYEELLRKEKPLKCPNCNSEKVIKYGKNRSGTVRYQCKICQKFFTMTNNSLFFSSKVNLNTWLKFLEGIISETSIKSACINAKISIVTGTSWIHKIFDVIKNYQDSICLEGTIYVDETYVNEDKSKIFYKEEIGNTKKVRKKLKGISRNKIGILFGTNNKGCFAKIINHGFPRKDKNLEICKAHIKPRSLIIGDEDNSLTLAAKELNLNRIMYKSNTLEAYDNLEPIDNLIGDFKFFIDKHRGFTKKFLQDYINLFIYLKNMKAKSYSSHYIATELLKMMIKYEKKQD